MGVIDGREAVDSDRFQDGYAHFARTEHNTCVVSEDGGNHQGSSLLGSCFSIVGSLVNSIQNSVLPT